jgi:hypothetical protein
MTTTPSTGTLLGHSLVSIARTIKISVSGFSSIWHDTPGEYLECTRKHMTTKYAANNSMAINMLSLK